LPDHFDAPSRARVYARETELDFHSLDVGVLRRLHVFDDSHAGRMQAIVWSRRSDGHEVASIGVLCGPDRIELRYSHAGQDVRERVAIDRTACTYGGDRPWFRCPQCRRRAGKLFGPPFVCRHCAGFVYASTRLDRPTRLLERAQSIRSALGGSASLLEPFPAKPRGMHARTYRRLRDESERLAHESLATAVARWGLR
jgi:hypothetical protein